MPPMIPCANTVCKGFATQWGKLCPKCEAERKRQESDWRWKGWTRGDEREQLQKHKPETK